VSIAATVLDARAADHAIGPRREREVEMAEIIPTGIPARSISFAIVRRNDCRSLRWREQRALDTSRLQVRSDAAVRGRDRYRRASHRAP